LSFGISGVIARGLIVIGVPSFHHKDSSLVGNSAKVLRRGRAGCPRDIGVFIPAAQRRQDRRKYGAQAVKSGATNPSEIEKLLAGGMHDLHVLICTGKSLSRIKWRSRGLQTFRIVRRRSLEFIKPCYFGPLGPEYLKRCKRMYRKPRFESEAGAQNGTSRIKPDAML
jgi:hypothetical protein